MIGMGLSLDVRQRLSLVCRTCGKPSDEHDERCPSHLIKEALNNEPTYRCPDGCLGDVQVAEGDFLRCRRCHMRFSVGTIADTENPRWVLLHKVRPDEDFVEAYALAVRGKGRGKFNIDAKVKVLAVQEKEWRRQRREARAEERAARPTCKAAFSQRTGVYDPTIECGRNARYKINDDDLCTFCARRRCRALGIELPQPAYGKEKA